jgi:hypothetical protein
MQAHYKIVSHSVHESTEIASFVWEKYKSDIAL